MAITQPIASKSRLSVLAPHRVGLLVLGLFSVPVFFLALPWLGLYNDDWYFFLLLRTTWQKLFLDWSSWTRPVVGLAWTTGRMLFGTYIPGYYLLLFLLQVGAAGFLFLTLLELRPHATGWALATGALFLVFPNDQTRFWLSTFTYRLGMFFLLLSAYLAGRAAAPGRKDVGALAVLGYALAAFSSEVCLPLLVVPALVSWWRRRERSLRAFIRATLPYGGVALLYGTYRLAMPPLAGWADAKAGSWQLSGEAFTYKLQRAYQVNLYEVWQYSWQRLAGLSNQGLLVVGAGCLLFLIALAFLCWQSRQRTKANAPAYREARIDLCFALLGLLLMYLAYLPILPTIYGISLGTIDSRVNAAAALGAALTFASLTHAVASLLGAVARRPGLRDGLFATAVTFLLVLASGQQYAVRQDYVLAWREQSSLWRQLLSQVPDVGEEACILVAVPRDKIGTATVLASIWEVSSAVRLLYNNPSIRGDVLWGCELPVTDQPGEAWKTQFRADYFQLRGSTMPLRYDHLVLAEFDADGQLQILYTRPAWATEQLTELYTHPAMIAQEPASSPFRRVLRSPFGWPWER